MPEQIVNPERYPKLFSIIFGESIIKDTITVTLFDAATHIVNKFGSVKNDIHLGQDVGFLILDFIMAVLGSMLIGIIAAFITTFLFRKFRFLVSKEGIAEVGLTMLTGYGAYICGEWVQFSGVISMLFCGITLSHFNTYNLSENGKMAAK